MPQVAIGALAKALGVSASHLRVLTERGVLSSTTTAGGHRRYDLDVAIAEWNRHRTDGASDPTVVYSESLRLDGLAEHEVWLGIRPALFPDGERTAAWQIEGYALSEMLNNAIDHSRGRAVLVTVEQDRDVITTSIVDDGIGVFENLVQGAGLRDAVAAIAELTKGKLTTDPSRHTGQGIFFTSKAVDVFSLAANGVRWIVDNLRDDVAIARSDVVTGTAVTFSISRSTTRSLTGIFDEFSSVDGGFTRTRPIVRLFEIGTEFVSRSEAKRLAARLEQFEEVELDFDRVDGVGQGFVDELFRVWANDHPGTSLIPIRMNPEVRWMVERGRPNDDSGRSR